MGPTVALAALMGRRRPLFVGWSLTDDCDGECRYCGRPARGLAGLGAERALAVADEMIAAGVVRVSLTGGEPLLHPAALDVAGRLTAGGAAVALNTRGARLPGLVDSLRGVVASVTVSVDGGPAEHDRLRGSGSWQAAVDGARAARDVGLPVQLHTVITARNTGAVGEVLELAGALGGKVGFSVLEQVPALENRDLSSLMPTRDQWRAVVDELLERKRAGDRRIQNSAVGLRYLRHWPRYRPIRCSAGLVYARLEPDGRLYGCGNLIADGDGRDLTSMTFSEAFEALPLRACRACWCDTRVEMNLVVAGSPSALAAAWSR